MPKNANGIFGLQNEGGLMTEETMENLGFTKENSFENEKERKKQLAERFLKLSSSAKKTVEDHFEKEFGSKEEKKGKDEYEV